MKYITILSYLSFAKFLFILVFPDLSLYYNNYKLENPTNSFDLLSKRNRQLELKCTAVNSRPAAKLTWFINKVEVEHFMVHNLMERGNEDKLNTFDSESTLRFTPYLNQVNISCVYISLKPISINLTLNIEYTGPHGKYCHIPSLPQTICFRGLKSSTVSISIILI